MLGDPQFLEQDLTSKQFPSPAFWRVLGNADCMSSQGPQACRFLLGPLLGCQALAEAEAQQENGGDVSVV